MPYSVQQRNPEMIDLLRPDFQHRYEPNFSIGQMVSTYLHILGLRGLWTMGSVGNVAGNNSDFTDISGQGRHLTNTGFPRIRYPAEALMPVATFDGTNDYVLRADEAGFDLIGTEVYVNSNYYGATWGGWFKPHQATPANDLGLIGKWYDPNDRSYLLYQVNTAGHFSCVMSTDGSTGGAAATMSGILSTTADNWYFIVGRFIPSASLTLFVYHEGIKYVSSDITGVPATIYNGVASFSIGNHHEGQASTRFDGDVGMCFVSVAQLPSYVIDNLYECGRALYGA